MTIENIAAEIVEKLPELVRDSPLNAQDTIAGIITNGLDTKKLDELMIRHDRIGKNMDTMIEQLQKWAKNKCA